MSQNDMNIADQAGAAFRSDLNGALQALATLSSGATAPATTYAYQYWLDSTSGQLKQRNAANSGWIVRATAAEAFTLSRSSNTILAEADRQKVLIATGSYTQTLTAAATLGDGWYIDIIVDSGVTLTLDPNSTEQIDGATTKAIVGPAQGRVVCTGSAFRAIGFGSGVLTLGTEQAATSGVAIDFTGIPSGVRQIVVTFSGVSTNGTATLLVQIGDAGGVETTGYNTAGGSLSSGPSVTIANRSSGWGDETGNAGAVRHGKIILTLEDEADNTWSGLLVIGRSDVATLHISCGTKSLSAELDRVRITTGNGTDTFDAGAINIVYSR